MPHLLAPGKTARTVQPMNPVHKIADDLLPLATPLADLKPLPGNPRRGDINAVARSYDRFGQRKPVVAQPDGTIIAGNHQYAAAIQLGWTHLAVTRVDDDDATAKAFALADNRTADLGTYDNADLANMIRSVAEADPSLILATGYTADDLDALLGPDDPIDPDADPDDIPPIPKTATTQPGDVWLLGKHRVVCGDSLSSDVLATALNGDQAGCVMTDPPYNVNYEGGTGLTIQNDNMSNAAFDQFLDAAFTTILRNTQKGAPWYVWSPPGTTFGAFGNALNRLGVWRQTIVWVKSSLVLGRQDYQWQHENCFYGWTPGAGHPWYGAFDKTTVIDQAPDLTKLSKDQLLVMVTDIVTNGTVVREAKPSRNADHPTMKPIKLLSRLLVNSALPGGLVLDPFGGSGSTLIAAHSLGMRCATVELDPVYVDVICRRYQTLTGTAPILEATGEAHDFCGDVGDAAA